MRNLPCSWVIDAPTSDGRWSCSNIGTQCRVYLMHKVDASNRKFDAKCQCACDPCASFSLIFLNVQK